MTSSATARRMRSDGPMAIGVSPRVPHERRGMRVHRGLRLMVVALYLFGASLPAAAQEGDTVLIDTLTPPVITEPDSNMVSTEGLDLRPYYDSSSVEVRRLPEDALDRYRADEDFQYEPRDARDPETLWQKILRWLYERFGDLLGSGETAATFWVWFFRVLAVGSVVFVVVKLTQTDLRFIFRKDKGRNVSDFIEVDENIHEMNFDTLIEEAAMAGNYRKGVRLLYLRTLKQLTDMDLIDWRKDKTNREYLRELRNSDLRDPFADLTMMFEYIWYGDVPVGESLFRDVRTKFNEFGATVAHRT